MHRPERLRTRAALRDLVEEHQLRSSDLVLPLFLNQNKSGKKAIASMPGVDQWSVADSLPFVEHQLKRGLKSFILFGIVPESEKDAEGNAASDPKGPVPRALELYRKEFGQDLVLMADACFCEYTSHGHCGTFEEKGEWVRRHEHTLEALARAAQVYADAGADIIAPSGMVDGMVQAIREKLDRSNHSLTAICSYAVKYASSFYGPFREAAENAPRAGTDRKAYQMNPANSREALREAKLDIDEGADLLLVKPALSYLDILRDVSQATQVPVGAYQVSGEYSMIKAAAAQGWVNEEAVFLESLLSMKRAGAKFILTYWAPRASELLGGHT